ncbi:UDP-N-acetylmuramoyl-tripeptide--D-alanyl-D-alanine ligase [Candidatus Parcubacteria bacterium]|nr:UDP-N-acetylmuramoyl-tripeptide--D-alanyl-D-alanine ligase [Candidatus Parcubacteria bacterium]
MLKSTGKFLIVAALTFLARLVLKKYRPKLIAVAGSVGKTSTKDAIFTVLSAALNAGKSEKSYNSEVGVPLTILGLKNAWNNPLLWIYNLWKGFELLVFREPYPRYLVLETGADRPGDIAALTKWLNFDAAVLTRFGETPVHIEFFRDRDELIEEDAKVISALKKGGLLVLNHDDVDTRTLRERAKSKTYTFGFSKEATVTASHMQTLYEEGKPVGVTCKVQLGGNTMPLRIMGVVGKAQIYACLPALLIGQEFGVNMVSGMAALEKHETPPGRLRLIPAVKGTTIIDDTYNASPVAAEEALSALADIETKGKKIVVFADMLELGRDSEEEHKRIGKLVGEVADVVVAAGIRARRIAEGALIAGLTEKNIFQFDGAKEAGKFVEGLIGEGDIVLIKGSQGMRMERVVEEIMLHPEDKERLLVRQDKEWKSR